MAITKKEEQEINESLKEDGEESFLPEGTTIPKGESKYMRFEQPENRFRVLSSAIVGYELWVEGKPQRRKTAEEFTSEQLLKADINRFTNKKKTPQYFWAFVVFNYQTQNIEILEVTQVTVMRGIEDYLNDTDYGDPKGYDLIVVRDDSGERVEYRVKAKPPVKTDLAVLKAYEDMTINLNALFEGTDPFAEV